SADHRVPRCTPSPGPPKGPSPWRSASRRTSVTRDYGVTAPRGKYVRPGASGSGDPGTASRRLGRGRVELADDRAAELALDEGHPADLGLAGVEVGVALRVDLVALVHGGGL